ncbi:hypothetical protein ATK30_7388 [Amycolatopsis echigonensis]|uniref:Uncharacterized protein n=1 Tax=Amycolatopsis echigonensis TaxID=2576905 RepID=A0A2N3WRG3_9PSEU|nr:hypothetical protein ATK30_7388 [Amycolatopsis niigatensis]
MSSWQRGQFFKFKPPGRSANRRSSTRTNSVSHKDWLGSCRSTPLGRTAWRRPVGAASGARRSPRVLMLSGPGFVRSNPARNAGGSSPSSWTSRPCFALASAADGSSVIHRSRQKRTQRFTVSASHSCAVIAGDNFGWGQLGVASRSTYPATTCPIGLPGRRSAAGSRPEPPPLPPLRPQIPVVGCSTAGQSALPARIQNPSSVNSNLTGARTTATQESARLSARILCVSHLIGDPLRECRHLRDVPGGQRLDTIVAQQSYCEPDYLEEPPRQLRRCLGKHGQSLQFVVRASQSPSERIVRISGLCLPENRLLALLDLGGAAFQRDALPSSLLRSDFVRRRSLAEQQAYPFLPEHPVGKKLGNRLQRGYSNWRETSVGVRSRCRAIAPVDAGGWSRKRQMPSPLVLFSAAPRPSLRPQWPVMRHRTGRSDTG